MTTDPHTRAIEDLLTASGYMVEGASGILSDSEIERLGIVLNGAAHTSSKDVISYGLSSFGYDARMADDVALIRPAVYATGRSTGPHYVDPKKFDTSFLHKMHKNADGAFILPPHSFALTHTVEHFRVPDNVLVICLGKSTYARCFSGDTKVALADGSAKTFLELIETYGEKGTFDGFCINECSGQRVIAKLTAPRLIGEDDLYEVKFIDDTVEQVTGDHEWIVLDHNVRDGIMWHTKRVETLKLTGGMRVANKRDSDSSMMVESVTPVPGGKQKVYCLTAPPEYKNFALASGAFVSNCGLIVNVTPLEPGFVGQVTLELSNTTDVPVAVYPNEGICQFIFFVGRKRPNVTYADRGGKYQNQVGTTPPRMPTDV